MTSRPVSIFYISYFRGNENNKLIICIKLRPYNLSGFVFLDYGTMH